jgi:hypothetical protein
MLYPTDPEPEYVSINDNNVAVVTLQENNHIVHWWTWPPARSPSTSALARSPDAD